MTWKWRWNTTCPPAPSLNCWIVTPSRAEGRLRRLGDHLHRLDQLGEHVRLDVEDVARLGLRDHERMAVAARHDVHEGEHVRRSRRSSARAVRPGGSSRRCCCRRSSCVLHRRSCLHLRSREPPPSPRSRSAPRARRGARPGRAPSPDSARRGPRDRRVRAPCRFARYSSMSTTYQVSRTRCCGSAPPSARIARMFAKVCRACATKPSGNSPCSSQPTTPPVTTIRPFGHHAVGIALRRRPAFRLQRDRAVVGDGRHDRLAAWLPLIRGRGAMRPPAGRDAAQLEALQLAGLRCAAARRRTRSTRGYL